MKNNLKRLAAGCLGLAGFAAVSTVALAQADTSSTTTTTTTTAPVPPPVPVAPPAPVTTTQQTTSTTTPVVEATLHLRASYHGAIKSGAQLYLRPNGKIYNGDNEYVAHLANLDGDNIMDIPASGEYKILIPNGHVIASTVVTVAYDSGRTIMLGREDSEGSPATRTTTTTTRTTTTGQ